MEKNVRRRLVLTFLSMALLCLTITILLFGLHMEKESTHNALAEDIEHTLARAESASGDYDFAYMSAEREYVLDAANVEIPFTVKSEKTIKNYSYKSDFSVLSTERTGARSLMFTIFCAEYDDDLRLQVTIVLSDDSVLTATLYAIRNAHGLFISRFSHDDALEKFLTYASSNYLLEEWQVEQIRYENEHKTTSSVEIPTTSVEISSSDNVVGTTATTSGDTKVQGTLKWVEKESKKEIPLRGVKVEVRDKDLIGSQLLGTVYTDNNGKYSLSFSNDVILENGGCDLFLRIFAGDNNSYVVRSDGKTKYYYDTEYDDYQNVATGSETTVDAIIEMDTDSGKAIQISQAILTARDFVKAMTGETPKGVKVAYPSSNTCYYSREKNTIYITNNARRNESVPESYAAWDVIMHEYGHHIAYLQGIIDPPGGWHSISTNMVDHYTVGNANECDPSCAAHRSNNPIAKENAVEAAHKLIWSEAWATAFGFVAQEYSSEYIGDVPTVCNQLYDDYEFTGPYDFRTNARGYGWGANSELGVLSVLWDLFDTDNDDDDRLSLTYKEWWDVTTISGTYTFPIFMRKFYANYPHLTSKMGYNLAYYRIVPEMYYLESSVVELKSGMEAFNIYYSSRWESSCYQYDEIYVTVFSEDYSQSYTTPQPLSRNYYSVSDVTFDMIKAFPGEKVHIVFAAVQSGNPGKNHTDAPKGIRIGPYYSYNIDVPKRLLKTSVANNEVTITGTYCDLSGQFKIPASIDGYPVTKIGNYAFEWQSEVKFFIFEDYTLVDTIGMGAFKDCTDLGLFRIPDKVTKIAPNTFFNCGSMIFTHISDYPLTEIGMSAFYQTELNLTKTIEPSITKIDFGAFWHAGLTASFKFPANTQLNYLGKYSFADNPKMTGIILPKSITTIESRAFQDCSLLTVYTDASSRPSGWKYDWNPSDRPVFWRCTFSDDNSYVVSFMHTGYFGNYENIANPSRDGYSFDGWYTTSDFSGTQYTNETLDTAPSGTLYAKWTEIACVAEGSLITLADGSQVAVENLTGNERLLVWNMLTGQFDTAPILFIDSESLSSYEVIKLTFSDGTEVRIIDEHAFFDMTLGEYVFLREDAARYIGHYFNKQSGDTWTTVQLTNVTVTVESTTAWSPVTYGHLCYYVNGMLTMPGATEGFINIFDVDTAQMKYDATAMANDIETYGLYTYEEFNALIPLPEFVFNAFNGQYLKVSVGKGLITLSEIADLLQRYSVFFN